MKKTRSLFAVLVAAAVLLSAGCAAKPSQQDPGNADEPAQSVTQEGTATNADDPAQSVEQADTAAETQQDPPETQSDDVFTDPEDDEIIDPDEYDEIELRESFEDGDWVWVKLEGGNWEASSYKGSDANVTVPQEFRGGTVTTVGVWCFRDNTSVKHVTIPDCVVVVDENCFMGCSNLESVQMPARLNTMGDQTFSKCRSLKRCVVPEGVKELDYRQFDECESLQEVVLPSTLTAIGEAAFRHCYNLKTIYFRGGDADWKGVTISSNALIDSDYQVVTGYEGK